jgi:hypothetical protein
MEMKEELKQIKTKMHDQELVDFDFTHEMKSKVLTRVDASLKKERRGVWMKKLTTIGLTAVFLTVSGFLVNQLITGTDEPLKGHNKDNQVQEIEKPNMITPSYIPEGYEYERFYSNKEIYEHLFTKTGDEKWFYVYRLQKEKPHIDMEQSEHLQLTPEINGTLYQFQQQSILVWEDEGFYQLLEKNGTMSQLDFLKITDSLMRDKNYISSLENKIKALEKSLNQPELKASDAEVTFMKLENLFREVSKDIDNDVDFKFKSFHTKDELYAIHSDIMERNVFEWLYEIRLDEREDGLYAIPMDGPKAFHKETPYTLEKINDQQYQLIQHIESELHGNVTLTILFEHIDGKWKIVEYS